MALVQEDGFSTAFRGQLCKVSGFIEPADRSVGIMGDSFVVDRIVLPDGVEVDLDTVLEGEFLALDEAYFAYRDAEEEQQNRHQYEDDGEAQEE